MCIKNYITDLYNPANRPENLEFEPEEVAADEKRPYTLHSEVKKAIKKITDDDNDDNNDGPMDVLKLLGEDGLKAMTQHMNNIHES
jgi:hypothetical protein